MLDLSWWPRAAAALVLFACACARPAPIPEATWKDVGYPLRSYQLDSGLRVLAEEDDGSPLLSVALVVGAGAADDPPQKAGLAHLVEHLVFRSRDADGHTLREVLEFSGAADFNAETRKDVTVYTFVAHRAALPVVAAIVHRELTAPLEGIDEAVFEVERGVVVAEMRESSDLGAHGALYDALWARAFPADHPYARPTGGTEASLASLTLADARAFAARSYLPENATLAVTGGVNPGALRRYLDQRFGEAAQRTRHVAPPTADAAPKVPAPPPLRFERLSVPVADHELLLTWTLPRGFGPEGAANLAAVDRVEAILSRISREDPDVASVDVDYVPGLEASLAVATVRLREGRRADQTAELLGTRLESFIADRSGWLLPEVRAVGRAELADHVLSLENPATRSEDLAQRTHFTGQPSAAKTLEALLKVSRESLLERLTLFSNQRMRAVYLHPFGSVTPPGGLLSGGKETGSGPRPADRAEPVTVAVPKEALRRFAVHSGTKAALTEQLPNGLEINVVKTRHKDVVTVVLDVPAGTAFADPPGSAVLGSVLAFRGDYSQETPLHAGAQFYSSLRDDARALVLRGQPQNLRGILMWLERETDRFEVEAGFLPMIEFEVLPVLEKVEARPQARLERAFWSRLYPDHPYGRIITAEDLSHVSDGEIESWLERSHSPRDAVLTIVGDVDATAALALAREIFGPWEDSGDRVVAPAPATSGGAAGPEVLYAEVKDAQQAAVHLGCLLPAKDAREAVVHEVLAAALYGSLTRALRERVGLTYGVGVSRQGLRGGSGHLLVDTNVFSGHLAQALTVLRQRLAPDGAGLPPEEVERARWDVVRTGNLNHLSTLGVARLLTTARRQGFPLESVDRLAEEAASVTAEEVNAALKRCGARWVLALTGAPEVIRPAALEAGWEASAPKAGEGP